LRPEEEIRPALVAHEEAEAVRMPLHAPAEEIELLHDAQRVAAVADDLAVSQHRADPAREGVAVLRRDIQQALQLALLDGHAALLQGLEDEFPACHRALIAARLAGVMGIAGTPPRRDGAT